MRVLPVTFNSVSNVSKNRACRMRNCDGEPTCQPQFRGKAGAFVGIIAGGAAAVALAFTAAPVLVCAGPLLGTLGGYACDKAEDKLRGKEEEE